MEICGDCLSGLMGWCRQTGGAMDCTEDRAGVNYDIQASEIGLVTDLSALAFMPQAREITEAIV